MKRMMSFLTGGVFATFLAFSFLPAAAQIPEVSPLVLTEPTDVGGTILAEGVYTIRVVPLDTTRNIVQVTSEDQSEVLVSVLTVPHALPPSERGEMVSEFVYYPATASSPRALRTWFAPDSTSDGGHDIVYPESRAMELARSAQESVVAYEGSVRSHADLETAALETVQPDEEVQPYEPVIAEEKATVLSENEERSIADGRESLGNGDEYQLPQTAGRGPLLLLVGALSFVSALGVRRFHA